MVFGFALATVVDAIDLGEVYPIGLEMMILDRSSSRFPDVLFIARRNLDRLDAQGLKGPADLVAEIVNDESATRDRDEKFAEYAVAGVPEYWLVDSREGHAAIDAFGLSPAGRYERITPDSSGRLHSKVASGFWFDLAWLNGEPLPFFLNVAFWIAPAAMRQHIEHATGKPLRPE